MSTTRFVDDRGGRLELAPSAPPMAGVLIRIAVLVLAGVTAVRLFDPLLDGAPMLLEVAAFAAYGALFSVCLRRFVEPSARRWWGSR